MSFDREGNDLTTYKGASNIFVETGTEYGHGIETALKAGFTTVYSIELDEKFYNIAKGKFKDNPNVHLILGSSLDELPKLLQTINEPFFLWLDAHWSCDGYKGEMMHNFLPKELDCLIPVKEKLENAVIGIDDFNHYITNTEFCKNMERKVRELNPKWKVHYHYSHCPDQIFLMGN